MLDEDGLQFGGADAGLAHQRHPVAAGNASARPHTQGAAPGARWAIITIQSGLERAGQGEVQVVDIGIPRGAPATSAIGLIGAAVLVPIILAYTAHAYWVFRGKVDSDAGYHH